MKTSLKHISTISYYTFLEVIKSKVLYNILILGAALLLISFVATEFSIGDPKRVALDFGFGCMSLASVGIAIFIGVGLIGKEIESRTLYMVLSGPVGRKSYLFGRIIGMSWILALNIFLLGFLAIGFYLHSGGELHSTMWWALPLTLLECLIVLGSVVFFSLITNPVMSVLYSLTLFILGHALSSTLVISIVVRDSLLSNFIKTYAFFFPNLAKLNIKDHLIYQQTLGPSFLWGALSYGIVYTLFLTLVCSLIFERKNLD